MSLLRKKAFALLVAVFLLIAAAWPAAADTIHVNVIPLDPTTAFAIDASTPPPSELGVLKGSYGQFTVKVKNVSSLPLKLYIKGSDAGGWALSETGGNLMQGQYAVTASVGTSGSFYNATKSGYMFNNNVNPDESLDITFRIHLPAVVDTGPQMIMIDIYGATS